MIKKRKNKIFKFTKTWSVKFIQEAKSTREKVKNAEIYQFKLQMWRKTNKTSQKRLLSGLVQKLLLTGTWVTQNMEVCKSQIKTQDNLSRVLWRTKSLTVSLWMSKQWSLQFNRKTLRSRRGNKGLKICWGRTMFLRKIQHQTTLGGTIFSSFRKCHRSEVTTQTGNQIDNFWTCVSFMYKLVESSDAENGRRKNSKYLYFSQKGDDSNMSFSEK